MKMSEIVTITDTNGHRVVVPQPFRGFHQNNRGLVRFTGKDINEEIFRVQFQTEEQASNVFLDLLCGKKEITTRGVILSP